MYASLFIYLFLLNEHSQVGLKESMTIPYGMRKLVPQLDPALNFPSNWSRRKSIVDILAALASLPEAHP